MYHWSISPRQYNGREEHNRLEKDILLKDLMKCFDLYLGSKIKAMYDNYVSNLLSGLIDCDHKCLTIADICCRKAV